MCSSDLRRTKPHLIDALLISEIGTGTYEAYNVAMFDERFGEPMELGSSNTVSREIALRGGIVGCRSLSYWIDVNHFSERAEELRALQSCIRRNHAKERAKHFCIPTTTASKALIELLHLEAVRRLLMVNILELSRSA